MAKIIFPGEERARERPSLKELWSYRIGPAVLGGSILLLGLYWCAGVVSWLFGWGTDVREVPRAMIAAGPCLVYFGVLLVREALTGRPAERKAPAPAGERAADETSRAGGA